MPVASKLIQRGNVIDIITTTYSEEFNEHINRKGRPTRDFTTISPTAFRKCRYEKIKLLKKYNRQLDYIGAYNKFNYFITIRGINKLSSKKFLDRVRKADKGFKYLTLTSWSKTLELHYHMMIYTKLSYNGLEKRMRKIVDYKIDEIYDQHGLIKYFKKNINYDIIHILKQDDNSNDSELMDKQIEILKYGKIINVSNNVDKRKEIKSPSNKQLQRLREENILIERFGYKMRSSKVEIEKFLIK